MNKRRFTALVIGLLCALMLVGGVLAMSSANYRLDWYVLLTGGGGAATSSTHYAANYSVGQVAIRSSSSTHYVAGLGYWYGIPS
ncbi:MAG TPA: hypothetical protein EYP04_06885 [Anaerolineae bacterium]|nr:hypothetical protein [Anaerolineae bacterium]